MRSTGFLLITLAVFLGACSDQVVEPEAQARLASQELIAAPFEVDGDAVPRSPSASKTMTTDCTFTPTGSTWRLDDDCTTDATIWVPDGITLDCKGKTITAVDPAGGHFTGAIIQNAGSYAEVTKCTVTTSNLANVCDGGADRLRGIMFDGASGSITHNTVLNINQGASGCQEGNGIEVRNAPFDGTHPNTQTVDVAHNTVNDYQKTGIVANGDVSVSVNNNRLSDSATQDDLAANTIQLGFGALGTVELNNLEGNQWKGTSNFAATAFLIFDADVVAVNKNHVTGNSDIGLYAFTDGGSFDKNHLTDEGADHPNSDYDIGIGDYGSGNTFTNNKVRGFDTPFDPDPLPGSKNKSF